MGNLFVFTVSPIIATRIGAMPNIFVIKSVIFSSIGMGIIITLSLLHEKDIKKISVLGFGFFLVLMVLLFFIGEENKGSVRWLYFFGFSLQPSEIIKPFFVVFSSMLLAKNRQTVYIFFAFILYLCIASLLFFQPDIGMLLLFSFTFITELFLVGVDLRYFVYIGMMGILLLLIFYFIFPHINERIDVFVSGIFFGEKKNYQVAKSLSAFSNGGILGTGVFEGSVKNSIPDAHSDFIFSVIGEEFGGIVCILIVSIYFYIALRTILFATETSNNFIYISSITLSLQILIQAVINISVTLNLLPTKGMTLPLLSYGGSSMLGISTSVGLLLALSKKSYGLYTPIIKITGGLESED
jgi:cell division protein FtsW